MAERQSSLELLRIASALGIVWFHAGVTGSPVGYIGLTVFLILTPMFELGANADRIVPWRQHARRLLVPFVSWTAVYLVANAIKGKPLIRLEHGPFLGLLAGPSIHLWYLPFMAAALGLTNTLKARMKPPTIALLATAALFPLLALHHYYHGSAEMAGAPLPQWFHALTPLVLGIICGASRRAAAVHQPIAAAILFATFLLWQDLSVAEFAAGFLLVEGVGLVRWSNETINGLATNMMGVYLVYPLALSLFRPIEPYSQLAFVLASFCASMIGVIIAARLAPGFSTTLLGTPNPKKRRAPTVQAA